MDGLMAKLTVSGQKRYRDAMIQHLASSDVSLPTPVKEACRDPKRARLRMAVMDTNMATTKAVAHFRSDDANRFRQGAANLQAPASLDGMHGSISMVAQMTGSSRHAVRKAVAVQGEVEGGGDVRNVFRPTPRQTNRNAVLPEVKMYIYTFWEENTRPLPGTAGQDIKARKRHDTYGLPRRHGRHLMEETQLDLYNK
jgi:hypothetical protein